MSKKMDAVAGWIDRAIAAIDPVAGLRRAHARHTMAVVSGGSYTGADTSRRALRNWGARPTSPDSATLPVLTTLRSNSRDLVRNNPLAGGAINSVTTAVIGTGLSVQPQLLRSRLRLTEEQAHEWQQQAKEVFELWASRAEWCDQSARLSFYGLQELAFRSALESGDAFAILPMERRAGQPFATRVQLIEADRCCSPHYMGEKDEWAGGIKTDESGRPLMAAIADHHPGGIVMGANNWREIPFFGEQTGRRNLLHICTMLRPGQRRGVPYLAPVMEPLRQLGTYTDAEIMAAVVSSAFTIFVKKPEVDRPQLSTAGDGQARVTGSVFPGEQNESEIGLGNGAVIDLADGEEVSFANPSRPNTAFDPFVQAILRQIGVALELPFEVLIKHYTSSYSAARAALLEAWRFYRKRREWIAAQFCQPVYEAVITEAVLTGRLRAPGFMRDPLVRASYLRAVWIGDAPGAIDPMREAQAARERIDIGISDKSAETIAYSGRNWEDVHAQRVRERLAEERDGMRVAPDAQPQKDQSDPADQADQQDDQADETDSADDQQDQKKQQ